jgi:hypothetical protein
VYTPNTLSQTNDKGWSASLRVWRGTNNPSPPTNKHVTNSLQEPRTWTDSLKKQPKRWNMRIKLAPRMLEANFHSQTGILCNMIIMVFKLTWQKHIKTKRQQLNLKG